MNGATVAVGRLDTNMDKIKDVVHQLMKKKRPRPMNDSIRNPVNSEINRAGRELA